MSNRTCTQGSQHDVVLVVASRPGDFQQREAFRQHIADQSKTIPLTVGVAFNVGRPGPSNNAVMAKLNHEIEEHGDILLADIEDGPDNATRRLIAGLRWAAAFCPSSTGYFIFMNDDEGVLLNTLADVLASKQHTEFMNAIHADYGAQGEVRCPELPWSKHPKFPSFGPQIIGPGAVKKMAIGSAYVKPMKESCNLYTGYLMHRLGIETKDLPTSHKINGWPVFGKLNGISDILQSKDFQKYVRSRLL